MVRRALSRLQERVATPDPAAVVRVGDEASTRLDLGGIWEHVLRLYASGLHPAIGLCVEHEGRVVLDRTVGHVEHQPGTDPGDLATPDTPFSLFSASKLLTALVVLALVEDGRLRLDQRAADVLPELARHGKERIELRHLLQHTAGIPSMPSDIDVRAALRSGRMPLEALYDLRLEAPPGETVAYHPLTSWVLLGEIVERVAGTDLRTYARRRLLDPLGFRGMCYGVAPHDVPRVAKHARTGPGVPGPMARIFRRTIGVDVATAVELTNDPAFLTATLPSANVIATGREVCRFLRMMLGGGAVDGVRVLSRRTLEQATTDVTPTRFDGTFGLPMRYGLGVMMGGARVSLYGPGTEDAYGHLGFSNVVVYADPARDLCVSFLNSGKPMLAPGMLRWIWVLQRLALQVPRK